MTNREKYTHGHHDSVLRSHRWRTVDNSAAYAARYFVAGAQVLDVGCGPGTISADIAARVAGRDGRGREGRVVAIDLAEGVLAEAAAHAAEQGVTGIVFEARDVYDLPYADGAFDVVHAHQTLQHVADPVRALREMRRV
ncbi:class I SAM-dependent methyltransferase, partial [Actinocorallia lasiicapitis]